MPSRGEGNQVAQRQRSPEAAELLRAFRHAYSTAKHWHTARLVGTVLVALAAPVVIVFVPWLEHPLGAIAGGWALAARLVLRPAQERATRFAVAVQEVFDQQVLGLLRATVPQPPAYEQLHQQAQHCRGDPGPDWYSVRSDIPPTTAALIAQRSSTVWSRRLHREWALVMGVAAAVWTLLTVVVAAVRGATVSEFLIAVLLPMLPALLDATDLCQAHWHAGVERSTLEAQLDQRLDRTAHGHPPAQEDLRALQDEINRQRLSQPPVPDRYYRLRRASYESSMRAAASRHAQRIDAAAAAVPSPDSAALASGDEEHTRTVSRTRGRQEASTGSTTPDVAARQIRYALSQLRSRNAHHLFEDLCRYFATERISRNILPATGPVSAGGDQGRDFETFRTYISGRFRNSFLAIENNWPVVFACTLQTDGLPTKIKADVTLITEGAHAEAVYYFCEADVPVGRRHELISWALAAHSLNLEIFDGTALAEQLAQPSLFWIAEQLLGLPASLRPSRTAHAWPDVPQLLAHPGPLRLPAWPRGWDEPRYNSCVPHSDPRFLLLDRVTLKIPGGNGRFEACDLIGPDNELIHVGRPRDSSSFGHLFNQALVSSGILSGSADARKELADAVRVRGTGRVLDPDFRPREVIVAFPSGVGPVVPLRKIPDFSRMTLARIAGEIEGSGATFRVVGIEDADAAE